MCEAIVVNVTIKKTIPKFIRLSSKKSVIKSENDINIPASLFIINANTDYNEKCFPLIERYAEVVGFSFVKSAIGIQKLQMPKSR